LMAPPPPHAFVWLAFFYPTPVVHHLCFKISFPPFLRCCRIQQNRPRFCHPTPFFLDMPFILVPVYVLYLPNPPYGFFPPLARCNIPPFISAPRSVFHYVFLFFMLRWDVGGVGCVCAFSWSPGPTAWFSGPPVVSRSPPCFGCHLLSKFWLQKSVTPQPKFWMLFPFDFLSFQLK